MAGTLIISLHAPHTYQRRFTTADIDALLASSHHYIISRGISVSVSGATVEAGIIQMDLEVGARGRLGRSQARFNYAGGVRPSLSTIGNWRYWIIRDEADRVLLHGSAWACAALAAAAFQRPGISVQEVLYIGKAYGRQRPDGTTTRNAPTRLEAHEKLQRIYEDHEGSDSDIFVTPLLTEKGLITNHDFIDDDETGPSFVNLANDFIGPPGEENRVALVEEALIAYFKPPYNEKLLHWGRSETVGAAAMKRCNLRVLQIALESWEGLADFASEERPNPSRAHLIRWVAGLDETAQPPYSDADILEAGMARGTASFLDEAEQSRRMLRVFGPALPEVSPWGANLPSELSAEDAGD